MAGLGALVGRLISIGDEPADDEDRRLRKRVGVVAGYILVVGALRLLRDAQYPSRTVTILGPDGTELYLNYSR
jgi:hypothetical protein